MCGGSVDNKMACYCCHELLCLLLPAEANSEQKKEDDGGDDPGASAPLVTPLVSPLESPLTAQLNGRHSEYSVRWYKPTMAKQRHSNSIEPPFRWSMPPNELLKAQCML